MAAQSQDLCSVDKFLPVSEVVGIWRTGTTANLYPQGMMIPSAATWGLAGVLSVEGLKFCSVRVRYNVYPWQVLPRIKGGAPRLDLRSKEDLRPSRQGYFITVAIVGGVGAVAAAYVMSSGLISHPAIGYGVAVPKLLKLWLRNCALTLEGWVSARPGDSLANGDGDCSALAPLPVSAPRAEGPVKL